MSRLQEVRPTDGCLTLAQSLPDVLVRVSDALQASGFGLLTVVEVPPRAPAANLVCEISCLAAPPHHLGSPAPEAAQVLPCSIRIQAQGEQTIVITTMRCAVAEHRPDAAETRDAEAACACVQHALAQWTEELSI
jgi:uncharacterized protein (DUF302 family)